MKKELIKLAMERYNEADFKYHILPVLKNAVLLGKKLNADLEVIEAAAYLHDIGKGGKRDDYESENDHHIEGAKESRMLLERLGYDYNFVRKVEHCILAHRVRKGPDPETLEAKIIACADAMAHFDTFLDLFNFFLQTCNSFEEAVETIKAKVERDWSKKILPEARELVKEKHDAIMLLLNSVEEYMQGIPNAAKNARENI